MKIKKMTTQWRKVILGMSILLTTVFGCYFISADAAVYQGKTYYVSKDGSDESAGSQTAPFLTIQHGIDQLNAGDTLIIEKGTYEEQLTVSCKGRKNAWITIRGAKGQNVIVSGENKTSITQMTIDGSSYVSIRQIHFSNATGNDSCGILVENGSSHITVANCKFTGITASLPIVEDNCANAILVFGDRSDVTISHITIRNNRVQNCNTGWAEAISVTGNVTNAVIEQNIVSNTGNIGIDISGNYGYCPDKSKDFPRNCKIIKNTVSGCKSNYATAYGIYVDGGRSVLIKGNKVTKCQGGIEIGAENKCRLMYATGKIKIIGNTVTGNTENGITIGGYETNLGWVTDVTVTGNTCKNNGLNNAILTLSKCRNITISRNTLVNQTGSAYIVDSEFTNQYTQNITFSKNIYGNGNSSTDTNFLYHGKEIQNFKIWQEELNDTDSTYQQ